ncbi:MAG: response regulator [Kiritimatiellae bacterium]|nr:response regulator [Kiritimatiellia bacterium]
MKINALVFDDEEVIRSFLERFLSERGYQVSVVPDDETPPWSADVPDLSDPLFPGVDILLSDVHVCGRSGFEFVEAAIARGCNPANLALMSGAWTMGEAGKCLALGCKRFDKPFSVPHLNLWLDDCERRIAEAARTAAPASRRRAWR